jgi:hypothetical protein
MKKLFFQLLGLTILNSSVTLILVAQIYLTSLRYNQNYRENNIIIIIFLHGLLHLTCSVIDALPSFPGASTISSPSRFVVEGMFRKSGVVHSFKTVDPKY